jgi:hypothetical protein
MFKRIMTGTTTYSDAWLVGILMVIWFIIGFVVGQAF